jgi:hypothetical protein
MNFVRFDELMVNLYRVSTVLLRQNKNDGSFHNKNDYPHVAELYDGGEDPFIVYLRRKWRRSLTG